MSQRETELKEMTERWMRMPGGRFKMGSYDFYPDEAPQHERVVAPFEMAWAPVTNAEFTVFVDSTGYVTAAERGLEARSFPRLSMQELAPGSLVFNPTSGPVDFSDWRVWWEWVPGAQWRHPTGPDSDLSGKENHPVVQIAYQDALAYAGWRGVRLPSEAEHEYASGGGILPAPYSWGRERDPGGVAMANTWHGRFPYLNSGSRGWVGTSPVGEYPPNGFGLVDTIGNVWEWTSDRYTGSHAAVAGTKPMSMVGVASSPAENQECLCSAEEAAAEVACRVLKGGSYLSAPEYCLRYRPAARLAQAEDSATNHIGFRCARSL